MKNQICVRLNDDLAMKLDTIMKLTFGSTSEVIREAIELYYDKVLNDD